MISLPGNTVPRLFYVNDGTRVTRPLLPLPAQRVKQERRPLFLSEGSMLQQLACFHAPGLAVLARCLPPRPRRAVYTGSGMFGVWQGTSPLRRRTDARAGRPAGGPRREAAFPRLLAIGFRLRRVFRQSRIGRWRAAGPPVLSPPGARTRAVSLRTEEVSKCLWPRSLPESPPGGVAKIGSRVR